MWPKFEHLKNVTNLISIGLNFLMWKNYLRKNCQQKKNLFQKAFNVFLIRTIKWFLGKTRNTGPIAPLPPPFSVGKRVNHNHRKLNIKTTLKVFQVENIYQMILASYRLTHWNKDDNHPQERSQGWHFVFFAFLSFAFWDQVWR